MKVWGMSTKEFTAMLDESFAAIRKATRTAEAQHYARTRILAANLEAALARVRGAALADNAPTEKLCA